MFECKFDGKNLTINEKEDYVSIFPNNINITAIVGENGSWKSSVLNAILNATEDYFSEKTNFILVFSNEKNKYYTSNFEIKTKITKCPNNYKKSLVAYLNRGNNDKQILFSDINEYNVESVKQSARGYRKIDISKDTIVRLLVLEIGKISPSFKLSSFMYMPNKISIKLKIKEELIGRNIGFFSEDREKIQKIFSDITDRVHQILFIEGAKYNIADIETLQNKDLLKEQLIKKNTQYKTIDDDISKILEEKIFDISTLSHDIKYKYIRNEYSYFDYLDFDLIDKEDRRYNDLSHGEQMLFGQLLNLYFYCTSSDDLIFLFDEPEIALHPRWQKNYIFELYNLFIKMEKNYHFIFTSHSPFLLSDLPKQNIIFLEKDEKTSNCINAIDKVNINPFGANIHTLLSNGFFMSDGLMGEFAKSKINEIKDFYETNKNLKKNDSNFESKKDEFEEHKEYFRNIQKIIGEPFLQTIIKNYLDELEILFNSRKEFLDKEIKRLQELKESLND